jgi:hypothetical protein
LTSFKERFGYEREDMEVIRIDVAEPTYGAQIGIQGLRVHPASACAKDETCCIHKPSDHHMREWPLNWRGDRGLMERIDPETGTGHPDPDAVAFHLSNHPNDKYFAVHGCDGGCQPPTA